MKIAKYSLFFVSALILFCKEDKNKVTDEADMDAMDVMEDILEDEISDDLQEEDQFDAGEDKLEPIEVDDFQEVNLDVMEDKGQNEVKIELTCAEIGLCVFECEIWNKGDACINECFAKGLAAAQKDLKAYRECVNTKCGCDQDCSGIVNFEQFSDCVYQNCNEERKACFVGDGECRDIYTCRKVCLEGDDLCPINCLLLGTDEAQKAFLDYKKCLFDTECKEPENLKPNGWPLEACEQNAIQYNCSTPYLACVPPLP